MTRLTIVAKANLFLILTTAIWGLTFPLIRNAVVHVNPFLFVGTRFFLGALFLLPLAGMVLHKVNKNLMLGCVMLGVLNSAAYATQTIGLQTTPSARAAFITGMSVILVPLLMPIFKLGRPNYLDVLCAVICLAGLYILTGADLHALSRGDAWVFLGALLFAVSVSFLQRLCLQNKTHLAIAFYQVLFSAPLPLIFAAHSNFSTLLSTNAMVGLLFCAIFATSVAFYLQTKYQPVAGAAKAALIYCLEPVFAGLFGFLINGERLAISALVGGLFILFGLMLPALLQSYSKYASQST